MYDKADTALDKSNAKQAMAEYCVLRNEFDRAREYMNEAEAGLDSLMVGEKRWTERNLKILSGFCDLAENISNDDSFDSSSFTAR